MERYFMKISVIFVACYWTQYVSSHYLPILDKRLPIPTLISTGQSSNLLSNIDWWQEVSSSQSIGFMCINWPDLYDEFSSDNLTVASFTRNHFFADVPTLYKFLRVVIEKLLEAEVAERDAELIGDSIARVVARRLLTERATCSSSVLNTYIRVLLSRSFDRMLHQSSGSLKLHLAGALQKMGLQKADITYTVNTIIQRVMQYTSNDVSYYLERLEFAQVIPTFAALRRRTIRILNIAEHSASFDINDITGQVFDVIHSLINSGVLDCLDGQQLITYYAMYIDGMVRDFDTSFAVDVVRYFLSNVPGVQYQTPLFSEMLTRFQTYFTTFVSVLKSVYNSLVSQSANDTVQLFVKYAGSFEHQQYMTNLMEQIFTPANGTNTVNGTNAAGTSLPSPPNAEIVTLFKQILQEVDRQRHELTTLLNMTMSINMNAVFIKTLETTLENTLIMLNQTMYLIPAMLPWLHPLINVNTFTN